MADSSDDSTGAPPVPPALIGVLLLLSLSLAVIFLVAAAMVHTL